MIDIYDDVLEEHNAILVDDAIKQLAWKYDYSSQPNKPNKHWHILCGHNEIDLKLQCTNISLKKSMMLILILEST